MMTTLNVNDQAPSFDLPTDGGKTAALANYKGKKLVIYFYPKDDTPGCTTESKSFRDHIAQFEQANTQIIGVSKDSPARHDKFKAKYELPFTLVSDEQGGMLEDYGVWVEKNLYGRKYMGIERATYLLDEQGKVQHIWRKVKVKGHVEEVLRKAQGL